MQVNKQCKRTFDKTVKRFIRINTNRKIHRFYALDKISGTSRVSPSIWALNIHLPLGQFFQEAPSLYIQQVTAGLISQSDDKHALDYKCPTIQYRTAKVVFYIPYPNVFESETPCNFCKRKEANSTHVLLVVKIWKRMSMWFKWWICYSRLCCTCFVFFSLSKMTYKVLPSSHTLLEREGRAIGNTAVGHLSDVSPGACNITNKPCLN